jgi:hypothetical protein
MSPIQKVTWLVEDRGGKTMVHDGFVRAVDISDHPFGWGEFVGMLRGIFEAAAG